MKQRLPAIVLAVLLLLSGCGASKDKSEPAAPATEPPAQTEAPVPAKTPAPAETPGPAETPEPAPAATPEPTEKPEDMSAALENHPLVTSEGIYRLYCSETEGDRVLAAESGAEAWVTLRRSGAADYMGRGTDDAWHEWRGMPFTVDAEDVFRFDTPEDFIAYEMSGRIDGEGLLELSLSWRNPDDTTGGTTLWFRRVVMNEGADVGVFNGRMLSGGELEKLKESLDPACMAFCTTVYACPEEIDWTQVFYNGAGISEEPGETALEEYLSSGGWGELDMECIRDDRVREFVWEHTLTSYDLAEHTLFLNWFGSSDGFYIFEHGDTNAFPVEFYEAYADGELYKLYYMRADWENYVFGTIPFVLTVYIRDGQWQYVSNLPAERTAPKTLLTLCYYSELADAQAVHNIVGTADVEQQPWMEPYDWGWAVITAQEDGVRYIVETVDDHTDMGFDVVVPGEYVADGVLNKGESAAIRTNQPWHAEMRLTATSGSHYVSYIFGEDNWKHLNNGDVRRLVAHDLAGEGRGCAPKTEEELSAFLRDGDWALFDKNTGELAATLRFRDYRYLTFNGMDRTFNVFLDFDRYDTRPTQAPDLILLTYSAAEDEYGVGLDGCSDGDALGDYQLYMVQLDGEQVLTLTQVSEGEGILSVVCPEADEGGFFTLHRYQGTAESESQG